MLQIFSLHRTSGLAPIYINADTGEFRSSSHITLGARGDSYYEYLLKQWLQGDKKDDQYANYKNSILFLNICSLFSVEE